MDEYIQIATFNNEIEAELAQATLGAAGIESFLKYEDTGGMMPILQQSEGIKLLVERKYELEAKGLLNNQATEDSSPETSA